MLQCEITQKKLDEILQKRIANTYKFSNHDINKFILLLRKAANWEKFDEILLREEEYFYSYLNMEDITDEDYAHAKRVCKDFKINKKNHRL